MLGFDTIGPLPKSSEGYKYILVAVEHLSKWCEIIPLKTASATDIAEALFREVFCRFGPPAAVLSDRNRAMLGEVVQKLTNLFKVKRLRTSGYHPMCNGQVENFNRAVWKGLKLYCKDQDKWPEYLQPIALSYRATVSAYSTQYSPYQILFGKEMQLPIDHELLDKSTTGNTNAEQYMRTLEERVKLIRKAAGSNIEEAQQKSKTTYDKKATVRSFNVGETCWLYYPPQSMKGRSKKMQRWYKKVYISKQIAENTYLVVDSETHKAMEHPVHINRLREYYSEKDFFPDKPGEDEDDSDSSIEEDVNENQEDTDNSDTIEKGKQTLKRRNRETVEESLQKKDDTNVKNDEKKNKVESKPNGPSSEDVDKQGTSKRTDKDKVRTKEKDEEWYEAEKLLSVKSLQGVRHYLVKWKDSNSRPSWEPDSNISEHLKQLYHAKYTLMGKKRTR